jgi:multimeric flavodoxin WrbA
MQLIVFNGSPRKTKSNSTLLVNRFLNGYHASTDHTVPVYYLAETKEEKKHIEAFEAAQAVIIIFPLYTDAMPGQVKLFLEKIFESNSKGKKVGFIVQSGFPEAYHSTFVKRYLERLAVKLEWDYMGTVIKGGVEGIQIMPPAMTKKLYGHFYSLGKYMKESGTFDPKIIEKLGKPYRMNLARRTFFGLMLKTGLADFYWNKKLKENNAWEQRYAKPYAP